MIDFFIVGFPRSRMAWIANYLTWGGQACHFDVLAKGLDGRKLDCLKDYHMTAAYVGIADGGAVLFQDKLIKDYPEAKWVIVDKPYPEVVVSCRNLGIKPDQRLANIGYKLGELTTKVKPLRVPFDTLDRSIKDIARFVNPDWSCPAWRHEMLIGLNVQSRLTKEDLNKIPEVNCMSEIAEPTIATQTQEDYFKLLQEICGDNRYAYRWLQQVMSVATIMDHVYDGDPTDYKVFDHAMKGVLLEWGINPFYRQYVTQLTPALSAAISAWQHSPEGLERIKHYDVYSELPCVVAFILGGQENVDKFSPKLRQLVVQLAEEDIRRDGSNT